MAHNLDADTSFDKLSKCKDWLQVDTGNWQQYMFTLTPASSMMLIMLRTKFRTVAEVSRSLVIVRRLRSFVTCGSPDEVDGDQKFI